ncbi:MAG: hypothetical protein KDD53_04010 [Bdellovibrionales bacterium]|nr:hypothetical protein [Bdellovibrionales bacterium]
MRLQIMKSIGLLMAVLVIGAAGCGGSSNNDQGTTFTLLGFFSEPGESNGTELPPGLLGVAYPLGNLFPDGGFGGAVIATLGLQNNSPFFTIRSDTVSLEYFVPGAEIEVPSTITTLATVMGPAPVVADSQGLLPPGQSSLPPTVIPNRAFGEATILPAEVMEFIILNKEYFPELPFSLFIRAQVSGVTSAGDRLETNPLEFEVVFSDPNTVTPTTGDLGGSGSGDSGSSSGNAEADPVTE